ncbi:MAG: nicotinate (nicotinamide) nucleotide adenylyltransferase [Patescibacteria group bacterium]|nr:nicotinate (nicotinamide) nucleotide adenylyltransferase [Patescibacteria group bacterium]MDD5164521.1 nicotinate (nicotinamide) nucleotide adenylyltransferase [Patescibacteria group bacterium]MDD5534737.1 nicotinate (nicotinamide) nucleotide adenylyltransferase [Patescibacteria group bacterium]
MIQNSIIIFGSSFNPPHQGHLIIIRKALKKTGAERIILMPVGIQPIKENYNMASMKDRLAMTKILAKSNSRIVVSDMEIKKARRGIKSYTIDTIRQIKKQHPGYEIYWVIGADSLKEILDGKWNGGLKIFNQAYFIVTNRDNLLSKIKIPKKIRPKIKIMKINCPISSTTVRKLLHDKKSVKKLVPKEVLKYIEEKKLYRKLYI